MKKIILIFTLLFSSLAMANQASYLFLASGKDAQLTHIIGNRYTLTINQALPHVAYFTDRPERVSGLLSNQKFVQLWTDSKLADNFSKMPPNAAVSLVSEDGSKQNFIAVMGQPKMNNGKVVFHLTKTSKNTVKPMNAKEVVLFIDDISWNPGGF